MSSEFVLTSKYSNCVSTKDDCLTARFLAVDYQHPSPQLPHWHWLAVPVPRNSPVSCLCLVCRYPRQGDRRDGHKIVGQRYWSSSYSGNLYTLLPFLETDFHDKFYFQRMSAP